MNPSFPWKGSYRSIPAAITADLNNIKSDLVVVAATKKIPVEVIASGQYAHVGLTYKKSAVNITDSILPDADVGRYATRNRLGWEIKRTDLPMVTKTFSWETSNFGDASTYGTHVHYQDREVYRSRYSSRECSR
jgi:hypothetical protein